MSNMWEIMGRLVADDALRASVLGETSIRTANVARPSGAFDIATTKYTTLRALLDPKVKVRPISAFVLGEFLRALGESTLDANLEGVATEVTALGGKANGQTADYFSVLGAITFDDSYRFEFKNYDTAGKARQRGFVGLKDAEFSLLKKISDDARFGNKADILMSKNWEPACLCHVLPYAVDSQRHPYGPKL